MFNTQELEYLKTLHYRVVSKTEVIKVLDNYTYRLQYHDGNYSTNNTRFKIDLISPRNETLYSNITQLSNLKVEDSVCLRHLSTDRGKFKPLKPRTTEVIHADSQIRQDVVMTSRGIKLTLESLVVLKDLLDTVLTLPNIKGIIDEVMERVSPEERGTLEKIYKKYQDLEV